MLEHGGLGGVALDDLARVHRPSRVRGGAARFIRETRVSVDKGALDLEGCLLVHTVTMNHVIDVESSRANLTDPLQLVAHFIAFEISLLSDVSEHTVATPFAYIERFAVPRIDQAVDVSLELLLDLWRKGVCARHRRPLSHRHKARRLGSADRAGIAAAGEFPLL